MIKKIALIGIILLAFTLRFYKLGTNPPSLYWDEVALGYNAFSIAQTLHDEEGKFLPYQYFRSFGDFKPPVYIYAAVPMIKLLGLSEWTTRFPSAFCGVLSVILTYLITNLLFIRIKSRYKDNGKKPRFIIDAEWTALAAAFLLAISPWHIQLSRVAYEANVALFLVLLGVYGFFRGLYSVRYKLAWFLLFTITFVLTLYTFNSNRVFTPLLGIFMIILYWRELILNNSRNLKPLLLASLIGIILLLPLVPHLTSREGQLRYKEVNIFSDPAYVKLANQRAEHLGNTWWAKLLNNRRILFTEKWLDGYFMHYSAKFLFISGDYNPRFSLQDVGELYLVELPFLIIGLYLFGSRLKKEHLFILGWLFLGPVPAAFARENPHALRALNTLPTFQILTGYGFVYLIYFLKDKYTTHSSVVKKYLPQIVVLITALLLVANMYYFLHNYFVHYPKYSENEWQYGYKEMVTEVGKIQDQYDRIVITDALGRPYINTLFYLKYPPSQFQKERQARTDETAFGFVEVYKFGKYEFHGIDWKHEVATAQAGEKVLAVGNSKELTEGKFTKKVIRQLDGTPVFLLNEIPQGQDAMRELGLIK